MSLFTSIAGFITGLFEPATKLIDELKYSGEEKDQLRNELARIRNNVEMKILEFQTQLIESKAKIITSETTGKALQRNWRPLLMYMCMFIIFNNYVLVPYLEAFGILVPTLEITSVMWGFLTVGVGGYIGGRSYEKGKSFMTGLFNKEK